MKNVKVKILQIKYIITIHVKTKTVAASWVTSLQIHDDTYIFKVFLFDTAYFKYLLP